MSPWAPLIFTRYSPSPSEPSSPAGAKITCTGEVFEVYGILNHPPDADGYAVVYRQARTNRISKIRDDPRKHPADAIMEERRKHPLDPATQIVPIEHTRTCRHHASKVRPGRVTSLRELYEKISTEDHPGFTVTQD